MLEKTSMYPFLASAQDISDRPTRSESMQNQMNQIPAKSLTILGDQMQHEYSACKKAAYYAAGFSDPQLKSVAEQLSADHRQRFERLYNYLCSHA